MDVILATQLYCTFKLCLLIQWNGDLHLCTFGFCHQSKIFNVLQRHNGMNGLLKDNNPGLYSKGIVHETTPPSAAVSPQQILQDRRPRQWSTCLHLRFYYPCEPCPGQTWLCTTPCSRSLEECPCKPQVPHKWECHKRSTQNVHLLSNGFTSN